MFEGDLLRERARLTPDKLALVCVETGRRLTYQELNARANRLGRALLAHGLRYPGRPAILRPDGRIQPLTR